MSQTDNFRCIVSIYMTLGAEVTWGAEHKVSLNIT